MIPKRPLRHCHLFIVVSFLALTVTRASAQTPTGTITGDSQQYAYFGRQVCNPGDLNGDAIDETVVSAPGDGSVNYKGKVFVFSGANLSVIRTFEGNSSGDRFGEGLSCGGDIDDDGVNDILVGAPRLSATGSYVKAFSGDDGVLLHTWNQPTINAGTYWGFAISNEGDVNNDGHADVAVGATYHPSCSTANAGRITVYSGDDYTELWGTCGTGTASLGSIAVGIVGDANGDAYDDVFAAEDKGSSVPSTAKWGLYSGANGSPLFTVADIGQADSVVGVGDVNQDALADFAFSSYAAGSSPPFLLRTISGADGTPIAELPRGATIIFVARLGDFNADGVQDFLSSTNAKVMIHSGLTGAALSELVKSPADISRVALAADINDDGHLDFAVSHSSATVNGITGAGIVRFFGVNQFTSSCVSGGTLYLQNDTETGEQLYRAATLIAAGAEVTSPPHGDYVISGSAGADVTLLSGGTINLAPGFSVEDGATLTAMADPSICH